jgi:hypothetical protein
MFSVVCMCMFLVECVCFWLCMYRCSNVNACGTASRCA